MAMHPRWISHTVSLAIQRVGKERQRLPLAVIRAQRSTGGRLDMARRKKRLVWSPPLIGGGAWTPDVLSLQQQQKSMPLVADDGASCLLLVVDFLLLFLPSTMNVSQLAEVDRKDNLYMLQHYNTRLDRPPPEPHLGFELQSGLA